MKKTKEGSLKVISICYLYYAINLNVTTIYVKRDPEIKERWSMKEVLVYVSRIHTDITKKQEGRRPEDRDTISCSVIQQY